MKQVRSLAGPALVLAALAVCLAAPAARAEEDAGIKYRVIVGDFEMKADHHWYHGPDPGQGMADMLVTALFQSSKFRVFERAALDELLAEKALSMADLDDPGIEAQKKMEIGDILVKGAITEFGYKEGTVGGGLAKLGGRGGLKKYEGRVAVDLRLISIGSTEILWADTVDGSESSKSLTLSTSKFSFGDQKTFDEHVVGKATRKVIEKIVEKLAEQTEKLPWAGLLVVADEFLFIDAGTEIGLAVGMEFDVERLSKEVKHPKTGEVLKRIYDPVGVVRATEVEEGVTTVKPVTGAGFRTGDVITLKK